MAEQRNREEVINTQFAILISKLGVAADAETIHVHGKHRPDVLFQLRGLRVIIEGKFADHPGAEEVVLNDARNRVRSGIAHIAAGVIYPRTLRSTPTTKVLGVLEKAQLKYRIVTETQESVSWFEGTPASLMDALRRAQDTSRVFAMLLALPDADVMRIAACFMARSLAVGSDVVDAVGAHLSVDARAYWHPDTAFFDLIRDRATLNAILCEVAGDTVARANVAEKAKTQKQIVRDCLAGANGRAKVEGWLPGWLEFPFRDYDDRPATAQADDKETEYDHRAAA